MIAQPNLSSAVEMTGFLLPIHAVFEAGPGALPQSNLVARAAIRHSEERYECCQP
jgi:hypothetical protein